MSYDLMVFEPSAAPRDRVSFMAWYDKQMQWSEDHRYDDPEVTSKRLQAWFQEMIHSYPPMCGPLACDDVDDPKVTHYSIGRDVIYAAFSWSCAEDAYAAMRRLALQHKVGFFDVSAADGEIFFPHDGDDAAPRKPWWKVW